MGAMPIVELDNVTLTYGTGATAFTALRGITLALERGTMALMLGPSGSGKTSLLQVIGCLLRATTGTVKFQSQNLGAHDLEALTELRLKQFGFVFQHYNLFPTLRAWENVAIALDLKGVAARELKPRALELLERLGLSDRAEYFPANLSGGQKQRVAIARAIAGRPAVILADEPTAALDGRTGQGVAAELKRLAHEDGCAVVTVSHDPRMLPFADRVLTLEDGLVTGDAPRASADVGAVLHLPPEAHP